MKKSLLLYSVILFVYSPTIQAAAWQETLEPYFDFVETFDRLLDWRGEGINGLESNPDKLPKKLDGSPSGWSEYTYYSTVSPWTDWIKDHGAANVFRGTGKSLCMDYLFNYGPSRLGVYTGSNSPAGGYGSECYIFFMNKYNKDFFPMINDTEFNYWGFLKTFQISTGFRDIENWGTATEQEYVINNGGTGQAYSVYGLNFQIMNLLSGVSQENKLRVSYNIFTASAPIGVAYTTEYSGAAKNTDLSDSVIAGGWFAVEYRFVKSNPAGALNGLAEIWVYDANGFEIGHDSKTNIATFRDGATQFNHAWNKFVWGGNRDDYIQKGFLYGKKVSVNTATDIFTLPYHQRLTGEGVKISSSVPAPLVSAQSGYIYYVIKIDDNSFKLAATRTDAIAGTAIDITAAASGDTYVSTLGQLYIDDIIIDENRIGPAYFSLLNSSPLENSAPAAPANLHFQ